MAKRKSSFNEDWLRIKEYESWLEKGTDRSSAYCKLCRQYFDVSNMGKSALTSHAKGKKHKEKDSLRGSLLVSLFQNKSADQDNQQPEYSMEKSQSDQTQCISQTQNASQTQSTPQTQSKSQSTLTSMVLNSDVTEAEILWAIRTCLEHDSLRSCDGLPKLFFRMFKNDIAKSFSLSRTKCGYFINFGIAPYFKALLTNKVESSTFYVVSYDESMNRIFQEEQMDFYLRYFDELTGLVETKFFDSAFLKRPNSRNLHDKFLLCLSDLKLEKLLQVSMDGPNVNWDVLKIHSKHREENEFPQLINIGSCSLHVVNGAFRSGMLETDWELHRVLHSMWKLFDESPARRDMYIKETGSALFALFFCKTRWLEDDAVAARAIEIWANVKTIVKHWLSQPKSQRPKNNKSYEVLVKYHTDPLIVTKLHFFKFIASILNPYLRRFQTSKPMVPFLSIKLAEVLRQLLSLFVRRQILEEATTPYKLLKIDLTNQENLAVLQNVDLGSAVNSHLKDLNVKDEVKFKFRKDCVKILIKLIDKLKERSLNYAFVRNAVCFVPSEMANHGETSTIRAKALIQKLYVLKLLSCQEADKAKVEFQAFLSTTVVTEKEKFLSFDIDKDRLDSFFTIYLKDAAEHKNLWKVCRIILTLSHGQADVERGFSVNKEMLVENMKEKSLVSQRIVCDQLLPWTTKLHEYNIEQKLMQSCRGARTKYQLYLEEMRTQKKETANSLKRKSINDEISTAKKARKDLTDCISSLESDITKYSIEAEKKKDFTLLTKANSFRNTVERKKESIKTLDIAISKLENDLKSLK